MLLPWPFHPPIPVCPSSPCKYRIAVCCRPGPWFISFLRHFFEEFLANPAVGAKPRIRHILKGCTRLNAVFRITFGRIVNMLTGAAYPLFHDHSSFLVPTLCVGPHTQNVNPNHKPAITFLCLLFSESHPASDSGFEAGTINHGNILKAFP